jgi:hypothetical protein
MILNFSQFNLNFFTLGINVKLFCAEICLGLEMFGYESYGTHICRGESVEVAKKNAELSSSKDANNICKTISQF